VARPADIPARLTTHDLHQHLWPEPLVRALEQRREPPRLIRSRLETREGEFDADLSAHDPARRLELLDRDGIDVAVLSCPPTLDLPPDLRDAYHAGIAEVVRDGGGRFAALASGDVLADFAGVCVAGRELLDLDALAPLLDRLTGARGFLFVHPGAAAPPPGAPRWWAPVVGYTAEMQAAYFAWLAGGAERWPELPVLFAILAGGAPFQLERLASRAASALPPRGVYVEAASYGPRALALCLEALGPERLAYGSDVPVIDPGPTLAAVRSLGARARAALLSENPARLLSA
jgi:6-methylsalicylate decarboxylase